MPRAKFMRHGYSCPQAYESFPFLWRASRMTKFAIEKYVSKHRTRELGRVLLKETFSHNPEDAPTPMLDSLFKRRGRSSHPAGSFSFARDFGTRPKISHLCGRSVQVRTCLACCWHMKKLGQNALNTLCRFEPAGRILLQTFRVYVTRDTKRNLFFLSEMAKRV